MSSTPPVPTTTPSPEPTTSPLDFSAIEGHAEHAWEDVKNLFTTGDITGHPEQTEQAAMQGEKNQATQNEGEADYKNFLYKSSPDEFKQAYPAEYLYRKAYNTTKDAITEPAEHMLTGKAREEIAPKIDKLAETGLGLVGAAKPGEPKPVIDAGTIVGPEGEAEESVANEFHGDRTNKPSTPSPKPAEKQPLNFDAVPGHKTVESQTSPHPRLPDNEYVYHATDKSRADAIRQGGLRPKSWYANSPEEAMKSGAVPISGNRADLRVFAVPRHEIEPVAPDAADMGAREVEKGRFTMSAKGHQPIEVDQGGRPLKSVEKPGNPQVAESAQRYNTTKGQPAIDHGKTPLPSKEDRASLADAYDAAKHDPNDPKVKASYQAMKDETKAQYNHAVNDLGIKFDYTKDEPYKNAEEMHADVKNNHHLSVFTGGEVPKDHPLAEVDKDTGQPYNNIFRATHDIFGHSAGGHDFSEAGEGSAYGAHAQMYSKDALPAVRTETLGQSNWFFNNKEVRNGKAPADFPEQKAAILSDNGSVGATPKQMVEGQGLVYKGELVPGSKVHMFEHPDHPGMTAAMNESEGLTPESVKAKMDSKLSDFGVAPKGEAAPTGYHPDLQKVADKFGTSTDASEVRKGASFVAPDGKFIHLGTSEHDSALKAAFPEQVTDRGYSGPLRENFIKDTGTIRTRFNPTDKAGPTLHISVPEAGVTAEQTQALKDAVRTSMPNGRGNIVMEVGESGGKSSEKEFATANNIEPMLKEIGAHPNDWSKVAAQTAKEQGGGFTIDPRTGNTPTTGHWVEVAPEKRRVLNHVATASDIKKFHQDNKTLFDMHPELHVGGYQNELNISAPAKTQAGAELVGNKLDQKSAWNMDESKEIPLQGKGEQTKFPKYPLEERLNDLTGRTESIAKIKAQKATEPKVGDTVSGKDVIKHVQNVSTANLSYWDAYGLIGTDAGGEYKLEDVPVGRIRSTDETDPAVVKGYANKKTLLPAVVLDMDNKLRDGNHRLAAAKMRGDKTIRAYVPQDTYKPSVAPKKGMASKAIAKD